MPFQKGVIHSRKSTGRPKGFAGVARMIMEETQDGRELVDWALKVFRNKRGKYFHHQQEAAHEWLSQRGMGRPVDMVQLLQFVRDEERAGETNEQKRAVAIERLRALSPQQLRQFREVMETLRGEVGKSPPVLDVPIHGVTDEDDE